MKLLGSQGFEGMLFYVVAGTAAVGVIAILICAQFG